MNNINELIETNEILMDVELFLSGAKITAIENEAQKQNALELIQQVHEMKKAVEIQRKSLVDPLNAEVKQINGLYNPAYDKLEAMKINLENCILSYQKKIEQQREAEQRRIYEEERKRIAEIEAKRLELEAKINEVDTIHQPIEITAEIEAKIEELESEIFTAVPVILPKTEKIKGTKDTFTAEITDCKSFVQWCINNDQLNFIEIKQNELTKVMQATKGSMKFPGVNCIVSQKIIVRSKK